MNTIFCWFAQVIFLLLGATGAVISSLFFMVLGRAALLPGSGLALYIEKEVGL